MHTGITQRGIRTSKTSAIASEEEEEEEEEEERRRRRRSLPTTSTDVERRVNICDIPAGRQDHGARACTYIRVQCTCSVQVVGGENGFVGYVDSHAYGDHRGR